MRADWIETTIGEVADYLNGRGFKKSEWETKGLPIIRIQNLNNIEAPFNYTQENFKQKYFVKNGDLLFSWAASLGVYIWNRGDAWLNQHIFKVVPKSYLLKEFLHHSLENTIQSFYAQTHGSGMVHITKKKFEATTFQLPPFVEQKAIVKKIEELFSSLDSGIADLKKAQDQLVIYRQAVLKKAFEGLNYIPLESLVISSQNGMSKRRGKEGNEIKVLRLADITNLRIDSNSPRTILLTENEFEKYGLEKGDLLIIRVNGSIDLVGRMIEVSKKDEIEKWAFCDHLIRLKLNNKISVSSFYFYFFQLSRVRKYIHDNMVSSAGQNTVSQGTVKSISVPFCTITQQEQIVREIESRLSVCDKVEESITESLEKAQALRQSILKKAFEGTLLSEEEIAKCKAHPDYEPASVLLEKIKNEKT